MCWIYSSSCNLDSTSNYTLPILLIMSNLGQDVFEHVIVSMYESVACVKGVV